jgi:hypothetical protein
MHTVFTTTFFTKNQKKKECRTLCYLLLLKKFFDLLYWRVGAGASGASAASKFSPGAA